MISTWNILTWGDSKALQCDAEGWRDAKKFLISLLKTLCDAKGRSESRSLYFSYHFLSYSVSNIFSLKYFYLQQSGSPDHFIYLCNNQDFLMVWDAQWPKTAEMALPIRIVLEQFKNHKPNS